MDISTLTVPAVMQPSGVGVETIRPGCRSHHTEVHAIRRQCTGERDGSEGACCLEAQR